ncbi:MAG: class I SAM-dependent methyltransferase [Candidatus Desulfofervidaceae bacterium]|nr:class I SAM-dependent methyltransferase [Candidatus Desulfofervidaceae bacterium]
MRDLWLTFKKQVENFIEAKSLVIYGAGTAGMELYRYLRHKNKEIICFFDDYKTGKIDNIPILKPHQGVNLSEAEIIIFAAGTPTTFHHLQKKTQQFNGKTTFFYLTDYALSELLGQELSSKLKGNLLFVLWLLDFDVEEVKWFVGEFVHLVSLESNKFLKEEILNKFLELEIKFSKKALKKIGEKIGNLYLFFKNGLLGWQNSWHIPAQKRINLPAHGFRLPGFYGGFSMWPEEFEMLSRYVGKGSTYLEVGSLCGVAAVYLANVYPHVSIVCVDKFTEAYGTQAGNKELFIKNLKLARYGNIKLLEGDSKDILPTLPENSFDVILIDADHSYEAVYQDVLNAYRLIKPGGVILFHDYHYIDDVTHAVDRFCIEYGGLEKIEQQTSLVAIKVPNIKDPLKGFASLLRKKWKEIPIGRTKRECSLSLLELTDAELLQAWEKHKEETSCVRKWYQKKYKEILKNKKILDFGAGFSVDGLYFALHGAQVTFADIVEDNLKVLKRLCKIMNVNADFYYIDDFFSFKFKTQFDAILFLGSIHHAPFVFTKKEVKALIKYLKPRGLVLMLAYPKKRFENLKARDFVELGKMIDGPNTPWAEWYDEKKVKKLFGKSFKLNFYCEFGQDNSEFNWFELEKIKWENCY